MFLRKIVKGGADKSYGIQVAKLAGVPDCVIDRAKEIVEELSRRGHHRPGQRDRRMPRRTQPKIKTEANTTRWIMAQMSLFDTVKDDDIIQELKELDLGNLTPIDALNTLYRLQNKLKNRW